MSSAPIPLLGNSASTSDGIGKRKRACNSCRNRKKRCDGERPTCALCKKWGLGCDYTVPASRPVDGEQQPIRYSSTLFGRQPLFPLGIAWHNAIDMTQATDGNLDLLDMDTSYDLSSVTGYSTPTTIMDPLPPVDVTIETNFLEDTKLPTGELLTKLIDIFFTQLRHKFFCFHKATFLAQLQSGKLHAESEFLLYAICSVASSYHSDGSVKCRQKAWYEQAKFLFEVTGRFPQPPLRTFQAALCLVYHAYTVGDFSACWLYIGKVWRQVVSTGLHRLDSSNSVALPLTSKDGLPMVYNSKRYDAPIQWEGQTAIEREECRRTIWLLFMMDQNQTWPTGWAAAVEERQFKIDIPTTDVVFQAMTEDTDITTLTNVPFTRNLNTLIASTSRAKTPLNVLHYLAVAHVLFARVTELIHSLHDTPDTPEYAKECEDLDDALMRLRLSIPRSATSILEASPEDRDHVVWLSLMLNTMSILLHYRIAGLREPNTAADELFARVVVAAKNTAQIAKDAARISIDLLLSAHTASSLYIAGVVLIIHWRSTGDESCKRDIELFELVFDRMSEVFTVMGLKFKLALQMDQRRDHEDIERLRDSGYKGLLADCSKWGYVADEVEKMGFWGMT